MFSSPFITVPPWTPCSSVPPWGTPYPILLNHLWTPHSSLPPLNTQSFCKKLQPYSFVTPLNSIPPCDTLKLCTTLGHTSVLYNPVILFHSSFCTTLGHNLTLFYPGHPVSLYHPKTFCSSVPPSVTLYLCTTLRHYVSLNHPKTPCTLYLCTTLRHPVSLYHPKTQTPCISVPP